MKQKLLRWFVVGLFSTVGFANAETDAIEARPKTTVVVLATGGTIAAQKSDSGTTYESGVLSIGAILSSVPEASEMVDLVEAKQVSNIGSQDMSDAVWLRLLGEILAVRTANLDTSIVITHGTDTIEETAYLLDLFFPSGSPIVLTGAMRSADANGADGPANLLDSLRVVSDPDSANRGVMVVVNGKIFAARNVRKTHTESLEAFSASSAGLLGEIVNGRSLFHAPPSRPAITDQVAIPSTLAKIGIISGHGQVDPALVSFYQANGYDGVVLAGVGNGNSSAVMINALRDAAAEGLTVMRASRVNEGRVSRNVEIDDDKNGFLVSHDLSPQKARILLSVLLSDAHDGQIEDFEIRCTTPLYGAMCEK